ncbi:MAG: peptide chain release factor 1 [Eubacteriales bacterium]
MLTKLSLAEARLNEIERSLADPTLYTRPEEATQLSRERKALLPMVETYRAYRAALSRMNEAAELSKTAGEDQELQQLANDEYRTAREESERHWQELKVLLVPRDPDDDKSVVMEIRAGTGGEEAALFAADLYRMYQMYAMKRRLKVEPMHLNETELGGIKEVIFTVEGEGAYARLKFESGVHRVQRVPKTESQGRIQTSTVTVAVLPEAQEVEVEINPADIRMESCKSSGAGGQHVNKTESAVRLTHKPTGIVVECQEERSQFKNRDKAMKLLRAKLYDIKQREQSEKIASERRSQVGSGERSEKIRTYNFAQGRVSDHRISLTLYQLENFLNGDMDEMIDALLTADAAEKLKGTNETA